MKIKILEKYSDYLSLCDHLTLAEQSKKPVIVRTAYYSHYVLVCKCSKISYAINRFCKVFLKHCPGMCVWRILMLSNAYQERMKAINNSPGGTYSYGIYSLGDNYYKIFLRVTGVFDRRVENNSTVLYVDSDSVHCSVSRNKGRRGTSCN